MRHYLGWFCCRVGVQCNAHVCDNKHNYTVVPALGNPCRERPPAVRGHLINVSTHFNVKLPLVSGHLLPNADADSHLLVVSTCYNGKCNQMPRFRWSFQPTIAGALPNLRVMFRSKIIMTVLSSGDQRAIFHVIESDEPRDCGKSTPSLVTFVLRHHVVKVTSSVFQPAMSKKRKILSLDQRIEVLRRLGEAHRV